MGQPNGLFFAFSQMTVSEEDVPAINHLISQLSGTPRQIDLNILQRIVAQDQVLTLFVRGKDKKVIGSATIIVYEILTRIKALVIVEDVVVDENYRGKGLAEGMISYLITFAKAKGASCIDLSSNQDRVEANQLYDKLGFKVRETNVRRLIL